MPVPALDRRRFLQAAAAAGAAPLVLDRSTARASAEAAARTGVFGFGVASGDPLATAVVLWTRVTPSPDAVPGSGAGGPVDVVWEVAGDEAITDVVRSGTVTTTAARDHTVKVDVTGLEPYTRYWYRFRALGATSPVGRTQTAPDLDRVTALRLGVVSCSNYTGGYFTAYRAMGQRDDLDLVLHLGDYVYEYGNDADRYGPDELRGVRDHEPATEMVTLSDYRLRYAVYRADPDLALAHQRHPWVTIFDDHEVTNDSWREGAENHTPGAEGDYLARRERAFQAYREWMPVRDEVPGTPAGAFYRRFTFGPLADLHVVDTRTYRDEQQSQTAARDAEHRELLGPEQRQWLFDGLRAGKGRHQWRLLGNQTVLAPVEVPPLPEALLRPLPDSPLPSAGLPFNPDQWDGYLAERRRLVQLVLDEQLTDVVVLTGDIHSSWANDVPLDPGTYLPAGPANNSVMTEFVTTSVTSDNVDEIAGDPGGPRGTAASRAVEAAFRTANRHIRFLDFEKHGYGVLDLTPQRAQFDWFWLRSSIETDPRLDPQAEVFHGTSWQTLAGTQQVSPASGPLGARSDAPRTRPAAVAPVVPAAPAAAAPPAVVARSLPATGSDAALPVAAAAAVAGGWVLARRAREDRDATAL